MRKTYIILTCLLWGNCFAEQQYRDASAALCFDEKQMISLRQLQELNMLEAFEAIYETAQAENQVDQLPQGFITCLEILRSGDDRVNCCDLLVSMKLLFELIMIMRSGGYDKSTSCSRHLSRWFYSDVEDFSNDMMNELWDIWQRLEALEKHCGLRASR